MESEQLNIKPTVTSKDLENIQIITGYSKSLIHMVLNGHRENSKVLAASQSYKEVNDRLQSKLESDLKEYMDLAKEMFHRNNKQNSQDA